MTLIFFEGFETCGDETGSGNSATVTPRIEKRVNLPSAIGSGPVWLVDNHDSTGFALHMGTSFGSTVEIPFATSHQYFSGADSPIMTIGFRVHIPDDPTTFDINFILDDGAGGNEVDTNLRILNSADLQVRNGNSVLDTAVAAVTPGTWAYIEFSTRADGGTGRYATAEVQSTPTEFDNELPITNVVSFRKIWESGTTYNINDEVRWKGKAYTSLLGSNLDNEPDQSPMYWQDDGAEDLPANQGNTVDNFSQYFIKEDPDKIIRTHIGGSGSPPSVLEGNPAFDYGVQYEPQAGDTVIIGGDPAYSVHVEGGLVLHGQKINIPFASYRYWNRIKMEAQTVTNVGDDFIAYDDIYITDDQGTPNQFLGPCVIVSLPPTGDTNQDWATSAGTDHYALVDENGADSSDYLDAVSNGLVDRFSHTDSGSLDGEIFAVRVEAEAINTTTGSPTLEVSMGDSGQISDTFTVDNTADYDLFQLDSTIKPGGGSWDFTSLDDLESGIESSGL